VVAPANPEGFIRVDGGIEIVLSDIFLLACSVNKNIDAGCFSGTIIGYTQMIPFV
jgi:hypothetical protein